MGLFRRFRRRGRGRAHSPWTRRNTKSSPTTYYQHDETTQDDDIKASLLYILSQQDSLVEITSENELPTLRVSNTENTTTTNSSSTNSHSVLNRYHQDRTRAATSAGTSSLVVFGSNSPTNIGSRRHNLNTVSKSSTATSKGTLYATIHDLPSLVRSLQTSPTITCDQAGHALRRIFALSEYTSATMKGDTNNDLPTSNLESLEVTRKQMIADGSLVPSLFHFLIRCYIEEDASASQPAPQLNEDETFAKQRPKSRTILHPASMYLALLILNNLCIPIDNKRYIAFQCYGIDILCHLLCYDPSCRMIAIVLVNLTFGSNVQFQHDLLFVQQQVHNNSSFTAKEVDTDLFASLAYSLRVASLTQDEYNVRQRLFTKRANDLFGWDSKRNSIEVYASKSSSRQQQLEALLVFDQYGIYTKSWPMQSEQIFPDTARWCICALHHLTRPLLKFNHIMEAPTIRAESEPVSAAMALTRTGIVSHLLCCIRIVTIIDGTDLTDQDSTENRTFPTTFTCHTPMQNKHWDNSLCTRNDPSTWVKESSQDAALFVIMNISIDPLGRKYLIAHDIDTVHLLAKIADSFQSSSTNSDTSSPSGVKSPSTSFSPTSQTGTITDSMKVQQFQCVKARMTLAYLVGSYGHYGQERARVGKWITEYINSGQVLYMKDPFEVQLLVDMLAHTLYRRTKVGPGGYSGTTFRLKYILWAIRCLLTQPENQELFAGNEMELLNALLIKILAMRALQNASYIDAESAEYACFSLYLLSQFGFHICFLPCSLGKDYNVRNLVTKVLIAIQSMDDTTAATHHAIRQILYRLRYLLCIDTNASIAATANYTKWRYQKTRNSRIRDNDGFVIESNLVSMIRDMMIPDKVRSGVRPLPDIFNRPIIASRHSSQQEAQLSPNFVEDTDANGVSSTNPKSYFSATSKHGVGTNTSIYYNSAILAAYDFSFQSMKVRHLNETTIDDIAIANNIVNCANGKVGIESYGYAWTWDDNDDNGDDAVRHKNDQKKCDPSTKYILSPINIGNANNRKNKNILASSATMMQWLFHRNHCCGGVGSDGKEDVISISP